MLATYEGCEKQSIRGEFALDPHSSVFPSNQIPPLHFRCFLNIQRWDFEHTIAKAYVAVEVVHELPVNLLENNEGYLIFKQSEIRENI